MGRKRGSNSPARPGDRGSCAWCGGPLPVRQSGPRAVYCSQAHRLRARKARLAGEAPVRAVRVPGTALVPAAASPPAPAIAPPAAVPAPARAGRPGWSKSNGAAADRSGGIPRLEIPPGAPAWCEFCAFQPLGPDHHPRLYASARVYVPGFTAVDLCREHLRQAGSALAARGEALQLLTWLEVPPIPRPRRAVESRRRAAPPRRDGPCDLCRAPGLVYATVSGVLRYRCDAHR
jgi:hypothetical protein